MELRTPRAADHDVNFMIDAGCRATGGADGGRRAAEVVIIDVATEWR
jgi:hypothetical protein